jgi:hypothetical protein
VNTVQCSECDRDVPIRDALRLRPFAVVHAGKTGALDLAPAVERAVDDSEVPAGLPFHQVLGSKARTRRVA